MSISRIGEWEVNDWDGEFIPSLARGPDGATRGGESNLDLEVLPEGLMVHRYVDGYGSVQSVIPWDIVAEALRLRRSKDTGAP